MNSKEYVKLKNDYLKKKEKYEACLRDKIKSDLVKTKKPISDNYMYSYADIAELNDVSISTVNKIAKELGLSRRK